QIRARGARLDPSEKGRVQRGQRDIDHQLSCRGDPPEEVDVARDGGRLRRDSDAQARYALDALEDFPCDAEPGFSRLVRIRRRADRPLLPPLPPPPKSGDLRLLV